MIDRRVFIHGAAGVAAALAGVAPLAGAWPAARPSAAAPEIALVDRGLDSSGPFAAEARARGIALHEFSSDVAGVWMRELEPRLRVGSAAIEGYTSAATLFCLELLARDYGARVVRRRDTAVGVVWTLSSNPIRRAPLAPLPSRRSAAYA
jgi:hypothetical protein